MVLVSFSKLWKDELIEPLAGSGLASSIQSCCIQPPEQAHHPCSIHSCRGCVTGRTINVEDDALGTRLQQEQHALAEGVILRQKAHQGVVARLLGNSGRHRYTIKLALQQQNKTVGASCLCDNLSCLRHMACVPSWRAIWTNKLFCLKGWACPIDQGHYGLSAAYIATLVALPLANAVVWTAGFADPGRKYAKGSPNGITSAVHGFCW